MFTQMRLTSCTLLALLVLLFDGRCQGQLTFHTDANENSYTIKTPGVQQSFTRFYGGGQRGNLVAQTNSANVATASDSQQQQQLQQHQQQYQQQLQQYQQQQQQVQYANGGSGIYQNPTAESAIRYTPQTYTQPQGNTLELMQSSYNDYQSQRQAYAQEQQQLLQQQEQQRQRLQQQYQQQQLLQQLYNQQRQPQSVGVSALPAPTQTQQQTQTLTAEQYAQYLSQQQHRLMRQQHEQLQQDYLRSSQQAGIPSREATSEKLLGVSYSPSDKVSHVNFASGNLKYNF